jgi:hypothetical protein
MSWRGYGQIASSINFILRPRCSFHKRQQFDLRHVAAVRSHTTSGSESTSAFASCHCSSGKSPFSPATSCPPLARKIFRFFRNTNHAYSSRHLTPSEGRIAIVRKRGVSCGGRGSVGRVARRLQGGFILVCDTRRARRTMLAGVRRRRVVLAPVSSAVDLTFASALPHVREANVKSKTPLQTYIASAPLIPTFATVPAQMDANVGIGLLVSSSRKARRVQPGARRAVNPLGDGGKRNSSPGRARYKP